jgi:uncharacterized protein YndB with AHSA1/START domain
MICCNHMVAATRWLQEGVLGGCQLLDVLDAIEREIHISAAIERVWEFLIDPQLLPRWYPGASLEPRVGAAATFDCGAGSPYLGVVEEVEPPRRLVWRWCPAAGVPVGEGPTTRVEIALFPQGDTTRVRIVESGFAALSPDVRDRCQPGNDAGWVMLLDGLSIQVDAAAVR